MQGDFRSAASADSGTAHYWQPVREDWAGREARGRAPDRGVYRCPERDCPAASASLRVMVAHVRAHRDADAELTPADARTEALARMRPPAKGSGWSRVGAQWMQPAPGPCVPPEAPTTVHPSLRYGGRPAVGG